MTESAGLILYSRPGCHLCEDMLLELDAYAKHYRFEFCVVDIDSDPLLRDRFGFDIPVLCDGEDNIICKHKLDRSLLNAFLTVLPK